nr:type II toxin-antitoxin system prevent-host-death family antitoxin [Polymorphobacter sp.]
MPRYSVAEAKNTLPRLIDRALAGEDVVITRHGKPVVEVRAREAFDRAAWLASLDRIEAETAAIPPTGITSVQLLSDMSNETLW